MFFGSTALALALAVAQADRMPPAPAPRAYVQPAFVFLIQPAAKEYGYRTSPNLSGHAPGMMVSAGGFLSRKLALEGEFVYAGTVSKAQEFSYSFQIDYTAKNRDLLFNELLRFRPRSGFEIVGGGGLARTTAMKVSQVWTGGFPHTTGTILPDESVTVNSFTLTGGVDAAVPASSRVALTPSFRVRWVHRPTISGNGWNGASPYSIQLGVGVRFR